MEYKVKESSIKGEIKDFPIEVVQKMAERQYEQTGRHDIKVFQADRFANVRSGGFSWDKTIEGDLFWHNVIILRHFNEFFKKYPKCHYYYIKRTAKTKIKDIIAKLVSLGGKSTGDYRERAIYYISPKTSVIRQCDNDSIVYDFLETFYTEAFVDTVYEYTMDEIAEKLGIDVK